MKKNKQGKIEASLTEVKNKTGDIFDLVDQYGEVLLTSYNKPRYKIVKIDIFEVVDLEDSVKEPKKSEAKPAKKIISKQVEAKSTPLPKLEEVKPKDIIISNLTVWDRNSKIEQDFIMAATKPLQ